MFSIDARRIYLPEPFHQEARISIQDEKVHRIGDQEKALRYLNALQYDLVPGFIDIQLNGGFGFDFTTQPETIWDVGEKLPELGITSFLPTIITSPLATIERALHSYQNGKPNDYQGANIPGFHLEGPFINPKKRGAHNIDFIQVPDPAIIEGWDPEAGVRMLTIAPELPGAKNLILTLNQRGVVISAGHSCADIFQAKEGFAAGVRCASHLFNAMTPIHHRDPSLVMAVLDNDSVMFSIICDGHHVAAEMIRLAWKYEGSNRMILISDAIAALGMPDGEYQLGDQAVTIHNQMVRLADGTLAGSVLKPTNALKNLMNTTKCSLSEALTCWTKNPASLLNLTNRGSLAPGAVADFVLLSVDQQIAATFVRGELVYQAPWATLKWETG
jgi:N-acetylglucosamine-6-phosphate deacetylase